MDVGRNTRNRRPRRRGAARWFAALVAVGSLTGALVASPATAATTSLTLSQTSMRLGIQRVGTFNPLIGIKKVTLRNSGTTPITLRGIAFHDGNRADFIVS